VIFLIMGMMIFVAVLAETNVFRWAAFHIYHLSRGRTWLLVATLMVLAGVTSAFLNNVTTILLLVPMSIEIAIAIGISPFLIVIPEVLASNIGGAATLIGDPPSTIVGSHIEMGFGEYMLNMLPIAVLGMIVLLVTYRLIYRKEFGKAKNTLSEDLMKQLKSESQLLAKPTLYKAIAVGILTFSLFFIADYFDHMPPSVVALAGAALLIAWVRPDMQHMIRQVDWTTLIFFISIFIVVGALEASGVMTWIASWVAVFAGESVYTASMLVTWVSGAASAVFENIPYTVAALPVADYLYESIPGASENLIIYWSLILGADFGGNATFIGSAPNIVAVGLLGQAGYRLTFGRFAKDGVPITILTLIVASIYLLVVY
jgi:Na+/H+ antiporter NhaD/arsenite permease-like protein